MGRDPGPASSRARNDHTHAGRSRGYGHAMTSQHDPDDIDPTNQSGRPVLVTGAILGLIAVLALLVLVYWLAR